MMFDEEYFKSEEFKEILDEYETALAEGNTFYMDVDDLADVADYYQMQNRYDDAVAAIDTALTIAPGATLPLVFKVRDAISMGELEAAREYLERIDDKTDVEYQYTACELLIAEGKADEAEQMFHELYQEVSADEQQDFVLDVANIYSDYGLHDKAMEWMMRGKGDDTEDFKELMARTLFGLGKYDDSERIFNELLDRNPFQKRYWNALASTQFMKEDYSASITSSEYAIAIDPDDTEGILAKANGLYRLDNFEEALVYFQRFNEHIPDDEFGLLHQGTCLINLNRFDEAITQLEKAEKLAPKDSPYLADIYQELAFAYSELHQPETALFYLDKTDALDCDHVDMLVIKGHVLLANERMKEAEQMFKKAIIQSGSSPKILLRIIVSMYDNKYVNASYSMFKRFFELVGNEFDEGYSYMALCCWDTKRDDEFLHYLQEAVRRNPKEARMVLSGIFPQDTKPEEYYPFMVDLLKKE